MDVHRKVPMGSLPTMASPNFAPSTIWTGDNLPVLRGMNSACVDLIYLDPPFNSNRNYEAPIGSKAAGAAFKDAWTLNDIDVYEHGELAEINPKVHSVIETAKQIHGKGMQSYLIFMGIRLIELYRILKDTGSIYLHCDSTASHYLKLLMDAVFMSSSTYCEIIWKRTNTHNDARNTFPKVSDTIHFYAMSNTIFNPIYQDHSEDYIKKFYRFNDNDGRGPYRLGDMSSPNPRPLMMYDWKSYPCPVKGWRYKAETMAELDREGRIYYPTFKNGSPDFSKRLCLKRYLSEQKGTKIGNIWTDIKRIDNNNKERTGYPTQKPLALLERIIKASSKPGDLVLDPFCGCATSLVAAERLGRQWAGIDLSPLATRLVEERIRDDNPLWARLIALDKPPQRTDLGKLPHYRTHRHRLYGEQEGVCKGCGIHFPFKVMEVDHILPKSQGGTDHIDNLQLLCCACNRSKGGKTMAQWRANS